MGGRMDIDLILKKIFITASIKATGREMPVPSSQQEEFRLCKNAQKESPSHPKMMLICL